jgi:hypothetical protein
MDSGGEVPFIQEMITSMSSDVLVLSWDLVQIETYECKLETSGSEL